MEENQVEEKKGWSWLGFFFAPHYYAGYGEVKKGIIYAIIGAFPLFGLIIGVIAGKNAKKDLPIGKQDFKWLNVALTVVLAVASGFTMQYLINGAGGTPKCGDSETKKLVIDIAKQELIKQGMSNIIPKLSFDVMNIRTTSHNKDVDSYQCAADFKISGNQEKILPITYTVETIDDGKSFYVNVFGF